MSIKARFSLFFLAFFVLLLGFYSCAYYLLERRSAVEQQRQIAFRALGEVSSACRESTLEGNWISAIKQIQTVSEEKAVRFGTCLGLDGRARAHSDVSLLGQAIGKKMYWESLSARRERQYLKDNAAIWEIAEPVLLSNKRIGVAAIGYDEESLRIEIEARLFDTIRRLASVSSVTVLAGLLAALILASTLTRPIRDLSEAIDRVKEGELDFQSPVGQRSDEIGHLAKAFNTMTKRLAEVENMKQEFVDGMTHDLKSPLMVILGYMELFQGVSRKDFTPKALGQIRIVQDAANRLLDYIGNILDASKLKTGTLPMTFKTMSLGDLARSIATSLEVASKLKKIEITARVEEGLLDIRGDYEKLHRTINNLVTNAFKFTPKGGKVTIDVRRHDQNFYRVAVTDTGVGIPAADVQKVFDRFFQVESTRNLARASGTGLGLTICRKIVENHGGNIYVESQLGVGTTFWFTLPIMGPPEEPAGEASGESQEQEKLS